MKRSIIMDRTLKISAVISMLLSVVSIFGCVEPPSRSENESVGVLRVLVLVVFFMKRKRWRGRRNLL